MMSNEVLEAVGTWALGKCQGWNQKIKTLVLALLLSLATWGKFQLFSFRVLFCTYLPGYKIWKSLLQTIRPQARASEQVANPDDTVC